MPKVAPNLVIFDLDNTLVDRARFFGEWARVFADDRNLGAPGVQWLHEADEDGLSSRRELFGRARERFGLPEPVEELVDAYWRDQITRYRCDPDTVEGLRALRGSGRRIGIATNGGSAQSGKIVAAGLDNLVDGWCVSGEVGYAKPDRKLFEAVAARCGAPLDGAWVVGDRAEADIAGAVGIGARSVWITRGREWTESAFHPTLEARSPSEAIEQILSAEST